jgi:long-chain acyl-CoA synthetase
MLAWPTNTPHKLATVGQPAEGHDIRLIDEAAANSAARRNRRESLGHSPAMMSGYHRQPDKTREAEWYAPDGKRFIRTGDVGRFDADGFLTLMDRKKDMIISGGFNVYPSDLEAVLAQHPAVAEAAVVGVASQRWGETPVAFVVARIMRSGIQTDGAGGTAISTATGLRDWANARLGKTQRLAAVEIVAALPRSAIGKILKRELRDNFQSPPDF